MKTVYTSDRIPHLWAHKTQDNARNAQGNFYFRGDTIYSYGAHFPIARHVSIKGKSAVLITNRSYSNTTARHVHRTRCAIPSTMQTFFVDRPDLEYADIVKRRAGDIGQLRLSLNRAKGVADRVKLYRELLDFVEWLNTFVEFFGYKPKYKTGLTSEQTRILDAAIARDNEARERRSEAAQRAADTRRRNDITRRAERSEAWRADYERRAADRARQDEEWANKSAELVERWRAGENCIDYWQLATVPTMLRIRGDIVETSRGAEFPVEHARRALPIVSVLLENGRTFQQNGQQIRLGHFAIDSIDENGTVRAGCHIVDRAEIDRLIAALSTEPLLLG